MISAPRIRPLATATERADAGDQPGEDAGGDHRGRVLDGRRELSSNVALVDTERVGLLRRRSQRRVGRRTDLVGLVDHAPDGRDHDAGHQGEQTEDDQAGGQSWA